MTGGRNTKGACRSAGKSPPRDAAGLTGAPHGLLGGLCGGGLCGGGRCGGLAPLAARVARARAVPALAECRAHHAAQSRALGGQSRRTPW
mgnify:CR=1 FL=1